MAASKHTHARAKCSPASVGLTQAHPNNLVQYTSQYLRVAKITGTHQLLHTPYPCSSLVNLLSLAAVTTEGECHQAPSLDLPCHSLNRFLIDVPQHHFRTQLRKPASTQSHTTVVDI